MSLPVAFLAAVERLLPPTRRFDDPLSTLAFGTDASFYRLIPKLVLRVESEAEVVEHDHDDIGGAWARGLIGSAHCQLLNARNYALMRLH